MRALLIVMAMMFCLPASALAWDRNVDDRTHYNFEDEIVHGDLVNPDGEILHARRGGKKESLVRVRESFISHLLNSIQQL